MCLHSFVLVLPQIANGSSLEPTPFTVAVKISEFLAEFETLQALEPSFMETNAVPGALSVTAVYI